jgi:hypothetical protein
MEFEAVKPQLHLQNVSLSNFFDKQQEIIGDMIAELNKKKDAIIMHRLEKLGIKLDIETEQRRRFKSFAVEYNDHEETYWYNDGSETGLRIVTFKEAQPNFDLKETNLTVKTEISYY